MRWSAVVLGLAACSQRPLPFAEPPHDLAAPPDDLAVRPVARDLATRPDDLATPPPPDLARENPPVVFAAPLRYAAKIRQGPMHVGDFDGDGDDDLVLFSFDRAQELVVFLGDAQAPLATQKKTTWSGWAYLGPAASADLDGDGQRDLVTFWRDDFTTRLVWLRGLGDGSFALQPSGDPTTANLPSGIALADVDGDGRLDAVQHTVAASGALRIARGSPDGGFAPSAETPAVSSGFGPLVVDLDEDGRLDVVDFAVISYMQYGGRLWRGDGAGGFSGGAALSSEGASDWRAGDLDGDGRLDLVGAQFTWPGRNDARMGTLSLVRGLGKGAFAAPLHHAVGGSPRSVALADFNGNGVLDVAVGDDTNNDWAGQNPTPARVCLGAGDATLLPCQGFATDSPYAWYMVAGDFDGDGRADLVVGVTNNDTEGAIVLLRNLTK